MSTANDSKPVSVLFLCTGNSCRSQMAEAFLRHHGGAQFEALSAGARPAGYVHDLALGTLESLGVSAEGLRSKYWEEVADRSIDITVTVCDAASADCPVWPGQGLRVHWGVPDPSFLQGSQEERAKFALEIGQRIERKILGLIKLPIRDLDPQQLLARLESLAEL